MRIFKERVGIVTGGTGEGIGRSIAFTMAREGAKIVINYGTGHPNNVSAAEKVITEIRSLGGKGYAFNADTRRDEEVSEMVEGVMRLYGRIDFMIVNSGGAWDEKDITEIESAHWQSVVQAEIDGLFNCVRHVLPHMRKERFGRIIAIGNADAGHSSGLPHDYFAGKNARTALIRSLAAAEMERRITFNVVAPSHTPRHTIKQAVDAAKHSPIYTQRTHALPQDAAEVVRFLCTDEAAFVNGSVIQLGGRGQSQPG